MGENFTPDLKIEQIAEAYSLDAVDFARDHFQLTLDWSDKSIALIEKILGVFHEQISQAKPSDEQIFTFAKMFGSYVGEVFRRNHGGTWGLVSLDGQPFPGMESNGAAGLFWPWGRAQNRLVNGPQDNMWDYYRVLLERNGSSQTSNSVSRKTDKKSWWNRLRGS